MRQWLAVLAVAIGLLVAAGAEAKNQVFCVFDILGTQGPLFSSMKEYALQAHAWGASLEVRPYVDERVAAEDFKTGQCDAVLLTGIRARQYNHVVGSIDSIGALPSYAALKMVIETLAQPAAGKLMINGNYEVGGIMPLGAAYLFMRDRRINSVAKMAGKKMAVLEYDQAQLRMAERIGVQAVASDVSNFAGKFNNGVVDVVAAPAVAYMPLELYKGVSTHGVVVKMPVAQLTFQLVLHRDQFPEGFGQHSREYFVKLFEPAMKAVAEAEDGIMFFYPPPDGDAEKYQEMMREARISMTAEGIYDRRMMGIMKKVRCRLKPDNVECSDPRE